jgi:fucose 4-O-acetylase-like acetyltransferase
MESKRLEYLDFCKVLAMFMVTMAHCAQRLSGEQFPSFLVSKDSFISVNMAIFMIASGFVMNIDKMKSIMTKDYILSKVYRLLVPMTVWFLVICIVSKHLILSHYWSYYW